MDAFQTLISVRLKILCDHKGLSGVPKGVSSVTHSSFVSPYTVALEEKIKLLAPLVDDTWIILKSDSKFSV